MSRTPPEKPKAPTPEAPSTPAPGAAAPEPKPAAGEDKDKEKDKKPQPKGPAKPKEEEGKKADNTLTGVWEQLEAQGNKVISDRRAGKKGKSEKTEEKEEDKPELKSLSDSKPPASLEGLDDKHATDSAGATPSTPELDREGPGLD